jgi:hypothetical protein
MGLISTYCEHDNIVIDVITVVTMKNAEGIASIIRVERINELGTLAVTNN